MEFAEFGDFLDSKDSRKYKNAWAVEFRESSKEFKRILKNKDSKNSANSAISDSKESLVLDFLDYKNLFLFCANSLRTLPRSTLESKNHHLKIEKFREKDFKNYMHSKNPKGLESTGQNSQILPKSKQGYFKDFIRKEK